MSKPMPITEFMALYPNDDACLEYLFKKNFGDEFACPRCGAKGKFRKLSKMPAYTCQCGEHIHPMAGTPFHRSHTPLQKWFYVIYLFTTTRHGVPAKELQRQLSVNYKTAWRMGHEIRKYLGYIDGDSPLEGHVEIDETMLGQKQSGGKRGRGAPGKTIVLGMVERGGDIITRVVKNVKRATLEPIIARHVWRGTAVSTDELASYQHLRKRGFKHGQVNHARGEWVNGIHHTNTIEGFWSHFKRSVLGTHIHISRRHLVKYLREFQFRWNMRHDPAGMFPYLLKRL